LKDRLSC